MITLPDRVRHEIQLLNLRMEELENEQDEVLKLDKQRRVYNEINRLQRYYRQVTGKSYENEEEEWHGLR